MSLSPQIASIPVTIATLFVGLLRKHWSGWAKRLLWAELCLPQIHIGVLLPIPENMTLFGERIFTEVNKLK